jgi:hypothetical protein
MRSLPPRSSHQPFAGAALTSLWLDGVCSVAVGVWGGARRPFLSSDLSSGGCVDTSGAGPSPAPAPTPPSPAPPVDCNDKYTTKASCDADPACSWCTSAAVPSACNTLADARGLPPAVFTCDKI